MSLSDSPQIDRILQRFDAIEAELGSGVVGDDFVRLSKEYAELEPTVTVIRSLRSTSQELAGVEDMMRSGDAEMEELARSEQDGLKQRLETLEHDLRLQLLPKDAADQRNVILEIRAGTGGDEAALFVGDLGDEDVEMVRRIADLAVRKAVILGNHDAWQSFAKKEVTAKLSDSLDALGADHIAFLVDLWLEVQAELLLL